jgi:hypothetical protein
VPERLADQVATLPWASSLSELADGLTQRPLLFLPLLLVIGALLWRRKYLYRGCKVHQDIGHFKRDSQWHTPQAILINILLAMPVALAWRCAATPCRSTPAGRTPTWARRSGNGPGLAGVLHRLPHPRARRRGRTALPLGQAAGRVPARLGPPPGLVVLALVAWWRWPSTSRRRWPTTCWASAWC